jgi:hypothetical protein
LAEIDPVIAREQFDELGPVIAQHVAAFVQFYAPALSIQVQGNGTVTSSPGTLECTSGTCSALFVQGTQVTLTANPAPGFIVSWGGDCASFGTITTLQLTLNNDKTCTALFSTPPTSQVVFNNFAVDGSVEGYWRFGLFPNRNFDIGGVGFTPTLASYTLDTIEIAAAVESGLKSIDIQLWNDIAGKPGAVIETIHIAEPTTTLITGLSAQHPKLEAGKPYWVFALPSDPNGLLDWYIPSTNDVGPLAFRRNAQVFEIFDTVRPSLKVTGKLVQ